MSLRTIGEAKRRGAPRQITELRKAFKPARKDRFCPRCKSKTEVDGDGAVHCACGWHPGMTLVPPMGAVH